MPLVPTTTKGTPGTPGAPGATGPQGPQGDPGAPQTPYSGTPASIGTAAAGTSDDYARGDHAHAGALVDLSDVSAVGAVAGDLLSYDGAAWTASTAPEVIWTRFGSQISPANVGDYVTIAGAGGEESTLSPAQLALYNPAGDCVINSAYDLDLQLAAGLKVNGAPGTAGDVLTSNGPGVAPTWQAGGGGGPSPSSATPASIGTAAPGTSTDYARGDHVHAGNVTGLGDRFVALPLQSRAQFASSSRDVQTAINAHTSGDAAIVLVSPGSYPGATVTIGTGYNNLAVVGAAGTPYGGTICSLSSGRGLTVSGTATRIRVQNLQIEGLTTWSTSGAGVHRIDRSQLVGGLTVSGFSAWQQLVITDCEISGAITVPAGFLGVLIFDQCTFTVNPSTGVPTWSITNGATAAQVVIGNSTGVATSSAYTLQGFVSSPSNLVTAYANGTAIITPALSALGATTPATNRLPYFASGSTASTTTFTAAGREIVATAASGTAGQVLTSAGGGGAPPTWTTVSGGGGGVDVQVYTATGSHTWTKPAGATAVEVVAIGGGGGGGSGQLRPGGNLRAGGTGGGGGSVTRWLVPASILGATESITVGDGGTGGAAQISFTSLGADGSPGQASVFGSWVCAGGGGGGKGANGATNIDPGTAGAGLFAGAVGGDTTGTAGAVGGTSAAAGGGGGGGTSAGSAAAQPGGAGGNGPAWMTATPLAGGAAGVVTTGNGGDGGNGNSATAGTPYAGAGGGGGASGSGTGGDGGNGGSYGGGGGGGGGGTVTSSGGGGNGSSGIVVVVSYL